MVTTRSKNHVTTPALVVSLSLAGYVATPVDPLWTDLAAETPCPRCGRPSVRVRAFERPGSLRLVLSCEGCRWMEEA